MRVLVAYGSKMGGTKRLAEMLGDDLSDLGHDVVVDSGSDVSSHVRRWAEEIDGELSTVGS